MKCCNKLLDGRLDRPQCTVNNMLDSPAAVDLSLKHLYNH